MKLYIAGPMTGHKSFNYPAFNEAADQLRAVGYEVLNPADSEGEHPEYLSERNWSWYMRKAIAKLVQCDGLALLEGWSSSRGATLETDLASELEIPSHRFAFWLQMAPQWSKLQTPPKETEKL